MKNNKINPFNNVVETGLRMLCILNESYPKQFDLQELTYFDYLIVHSGDFDKKVESLHPPVPHRSGELYVRHSIIQNGLELFIGKNLIEKSFSENGIEYRACENSLTFLETLEEKYLIELVERAKWLTQTFSHYNSIELKNFIQDYLRKTNNKFNIEISQ